MSENKRPENSESENIVVIEYDADANQVFLHADGQGLRRLERTFARLAAKAESGEYDHDHLMGPAWGGWELSAVGPARQEETVIRVVDHLEIRAWPNGIDPPDE